MHWQVDPKTTLALPGRRHRAPSLLWKWRTWRTVQHIIGLLRSCGEWTCSWQPIPRFGFSVFFWFSVESVHEKCWLCLLWTLLYDQKKGIYSFSVSHISRDILEKKLIHSVNPQRQLLITFSWFKISNLFWDENHFWSSSYRLELMRQIYNAESPDMAIFHVLDMMPPINSAETAPSPQPAVAQAPKALPAIGPSSSKNVPSRLSLANLLPSRLDYELMFWL